MFAGPNGSGKTTLVRSLAREFAPEGLFWIKPFVNADEILFDLAGSGVRFSDWSLTLDWDTLKHFLARDARITPGHTFWQSARFENNRLTGAEADAYVAASIAELIRHELLLRGVSFTCETVMSHVSKVEFLTASRHAGYRTHLYFICTDTPVLNVERVKHRVRLGGHDVPARKIRERYARSLELAPAAIESANRVFVFDNTGPAPVWLAEKTPDGRLYLRRPEGECPAWFKTAILPFARLAV